MSYNNKNLKQIKGKGIRELSIKHLMPKCEIVLNESIYEIKKICKDKKVVDIGCGYGHNRKIIEDVGGEWVGVEPFEGGGHTVIGSGRITF